MELTADALNSFSNVLPTGFFTKISETLGIPIEKTKSTMLTAIPAVFTELQKKIRSPDGIQSVATAIHDSGFDQPASVSSDTSNITSQINKGQDLLQRVLGGQTDSLLGKVTTAAGVSTSQGSKLLGAASAAVFTFIGSKMKGGTLAPAAFANMLGQGSGFMPDLSAPKFATNTVPLAGAQPGVSRKVWPWILLAAALGIIWWSQGRNTASVISSPQVNSESIPVATGSTAYAATDQTVMSELSQFLANPAAVAPRAFSLRELNFSTGSAQLSTQANATSTALAALLNQYSTARIRIVGHTDNIGVESANQKLSMDRAEVLRQSLVGQGIAADRIEAAGMGSVQPVGDNASDSGRSQNRRIDIEVIRR
ncbi:MAG: OmpA family protein [Bdellovibrionota bacterium]